jgi:hypothetical protein
MTTPTIGSTDQPFPLERPAVCVEPASAEPFELSIRVLPGWGVDLAPGAESFMSWYDPPGWTLTSVSHCCVKGPARVHGIECLEVSMLAWEPDRGLWGPDYTHTHFARLTEQEVQWLATMRTVDGTNVLYTFLDDGFDRDWGTMPRLVPGGARAAETPQGDLAIELGGPGRLGDELAAGMFTVAIGPRSFTCLRTLSLDTVSLAKQSLERQAMAEHFYAETGKLVLFRRYNGRTWKAHRTAPPGRSGQTWDQRLPDNQRLRIDNALFVHWYDCLTDVSLGIDGTAEESRP